MNVWIYIVVVNCLLYVLCVTDCAFDSRRHCLWVLCILSVFVSPSVLYYISLYLGLLLMMFFFFKQKPPYEMRIGDWSSDVCPSDLSKNQTRLRQIHTMAAHQQGNEKQIEPEADKPNQAAATRQVQESGRFAQPPQDRTEGRSAIVLPCRCPRRFRHCPKQNQGQHQAGESHCHEGQPPPERLGHGAAQYRGQRAPDRHADR